MATSAPAAAPSLISAPRRGQGLAMLVALAALGALAIVPYVPRSVVPASAPAAVFSAERALPHLQVIAQEPHPVGSPANARVRTYLIEQLSALGLQPEVQRTAVFRAPTGDGVIGENVLVRLPGSASTGSVMLTAHYDSVNSTPGAGDNGMAVAAMVETLRALRAGPPLRNDLIVLFNDGEEPGMYGSQGFVEQHPWAADVRVVFDFDADGPIGPSTIGWTTPRDGWLLAEMARAGTGLVSGPLVNPSKRREFKNDLHVYAAAGYTGAHLDVVGGSTFYHTTRDNLANVDLASLQHQGAAMLALARHFGSVPINAAPTDDATLLMAFGRPVLVYPFSWTLPLTLVVGLGFVLVLGFGLRRRCLTPRGMTGAALALVIGTTPLALLTQVAWQGLLAAHPEAGFFSERGFYGQTWFVGALYALVAALALASWPWLVRRVGELNLAAAGLGGTVALALLFAVAMPGLGYVALWPALAGVLALAYLVGPAGAATNRPEWVRFAVLLLAAIPVAGIMVGPLYQSVIEGLENGPALQMVFLVVLAALLAPQLALVMQAGRRWLPGAVALIAVALLGAGMASSGFSPAQPHPDVLAYGLDADTSQAYWITLDPRLDEWTGQFLADGTRRTLDELLGASDPIPVLVAPAPTAALPAPSMSLLGQEQVGDLRTLRLRLASPRQAGRVHLWPGRGTQIVAANLGEAPPVAVDGTELLISGLPAEGVALTVQVRASGPARFTVLDRSTGLPDLPGLPPRPAAVMSAPVGEDLSGYPTLVRTSVVFESDR